MVQAWLLFGLLALVSGQIIYPDQYDVITGDLGRASTLSANYPALQVANSSQSVQTDQIDGGFASQFGVVKPAEEQFLTTTRVPLYASASLSPQPMPETWANHVNHYSVICTRNHDNYLSCIKPFVY